MDRRIVLGSLIVLCFYPRVVDGQGQNPPCDPGCPPGAIDEIVTNASTSQPGRTPTPILEITLPTCSSAG